MSSQIDSQCATLLMRYAREDHKASLDQIIEGLHAELFALSYFLLGDAGLARKAQKRCFCKLIRQSFRFDGSLPFGLWWTTLVLEVLNGERGRALHQQGLSNKDQLPDQSQACLAALVWLEAKAAYVLIQTVYFGAAIKDCSRRLGLPSGEIATLRQRAIDEIQQWLSNQSNAQNISGLDHLSRILDQHLIPRPEAPKRARLERDAARETTSILLTKAMLPPH